MPYGPSSDDMLDFLLERAAEVERSERASAEPDATALENAELIQGMVARSRGEVWERRSWRQAMLDLARLYEDHPDFSRAWYALVWE